jgi:outer membrane protein insertion porin family
MQTARKNNKSFSAIRHYCRLLPFLYLIFGLVFFLPAQAEGFVETASATPKIMKLSIEGNRLIPEAEILEFIKSRSGNDFIRENIVADLEALYKTGYFVKSSIEALPVVVKDGVEINYFLKENPMVKDIYVYGNESETVTVDVYAILKDLLGRPQSVVVTSQKLREIEEKYATEGFVLARVVDVKWNEQEGILSVYVAEGELSDIVFEGNRKTKETYLRRLVARTKPGEPYNEKKFMKDFRRIKGTG